MKKYTITLSDEQLMAVAQATELISRFLSGQVDRFTLTSPGWFWKADREAIEDACKQLKTALFPELLPNASYDVGAPQDTPEARCRSVLYEVYRTILEYRTGEQIAAGVDMSHSVYSHPGLNYTGLPKPIVSPAVGWQPIETAPKDGRSVLLWIEGVAIEGWYGKDNWHVVTLNSHGCGCCSDDDDAPTHWQPLPPPPTK